MQEVDRAMGANEIENSIDTTTVTQPQLVDASPDIRHRARKGHRQSKAGLQSSEGIGQILADDLRSAAISFSQALTTSIIPLMSHK